MCRVELLVGGTPRRIAAVFEKLSNGRRPNRHAVIVAPLIGRQGFLGAAWPHGSEKPVWAILHPLPTRKLSPTWSGCRITRRFELN